MLGDAEACARRAEVPFDPTEYHVLDSPAAEIEPVPKFDVEGWPAVESGFQAGICEEAAA